ncbi:MAG: hypothetical protein OEN23_06865 [Paracoccaceae bacterium]|nr:hypothetical protein [Paracoccaceae bacterium]
MADPEGHLVIWVPKDGLTRYRFGLKITDFLLCATCGVYVAPVIEHAGQHYASLNVNMLDVRDDLDPAPPLASYSGETAEARIARRLKRWMKTTIETV